MVELLNWLVAHPKEAIVIWVMFVGGIRAVVSVFRKGESSWPF